MATAQEDFIVRYGLSSLYLRIIGQYADWGTSFALREHYKNGEENKNRNVPPNVGDADDNLYYYSDYMHQMTVPAISIFSEASSLVDTGTMVQFLIESKGQNVNDEWYELPNSAHMDVPVGNNAPTFCYPMIGAWLERIE